MNKEELLSAIAKTNKVIGNDTMPEAVKEVARNTKAKLEAQLAELEKGATPEPKKEEPKKDMKKEAKKDDKKDDKKDNKKTDTKKDDKKADAAKDVKKEVKKEEKK